jgi:hypothetical protein
MENKPEVKKYALVITFKDVKTFRNGKIIYQFKERLIKYNWKEKFLKSRKDGYGITSSLYYATIPLPLFSLSRLPLFSLYTIIDGDISFKNKMEVVKIASELKEILKNCRHTPSELDIIDISIVPFKKVIEKTKEKAKVIISITCLTILVGIIILFIIYPEIMKEILYAAMILGVIYGSFILAMLTSLEITVRNDYGEVGSALLFVFFMILFYLILSGLFFLLDKIIKICF